LVILAFSMTLIIFSTLGSQGENEPNDSKSTAEEIGPSITNGTISETGVDVDWFKFELQRGDTINISFNRSGGGTSVLDLTGPNNYIYTHLRSTNGNVISDTIFTGNRSEVLWIYIEVDGDRGDYIFNLSFEKQDDFGTGSDVGQTMGAAMDIPVGMKVSGFVADDDQQDCYKFHAGAGDIIEISSWSFTEDHIKINMNDPQGNYVGGMASKNDENGSFVYYTSNETPYDFWYLIVYYNPYGGAYEFIVELDGQNDYHTSGDAPSDLSEGYPITFGDDVMGVLENLDRADCYRFIAGEGDVIIIGMNQVDRGGWSVILYNESESEMNRFYIRAAETKEYTYLTALETPTQTFFIKVMDADITYNFNITIHDQSDAGGIGDAPGSYEGSSEVGLWQTYNGTVDDLDTYDVFRVELDMGNGTLHVAFSCTDESNRLFRNLRIVDPDDDNRTMVSLSATRYVEASGEVKINISSVGTVRTLIIIVAFQKDDTTDRKPPIYKFLLRFEPDDVIGTLRHDADWLNGTFVEDGSHSFEISGPLSSRTFFVNITGGLTIDVLIENPHGPNLYLLLARNESTALMTALTNNSQPASYKFTVPVVEDPSILFILVFSDWDWEEAVFNMTLDRTSTITYDEPAIGNITYGRWTAGVDHEISVDISFNDPRDNRVRLHYRVPPEYDYRELIPELVGDVWVFTVPGEDIAQEGIAFYLQASDASHSVFHPREGSIDPLLHPWRYTLQHHGFDPTRIDEKLVVRLNVTGPEPPETVSVLIRTSGDVEYRELPMVAETGSYNLDISGHLEVGTLEYYFVARNPIGFPTFLGSPDEPLTTEIIDVDVNRPPSTPVILKPGNHTYHEEGTEILFSAEVFDLDMKHGQELLVTWESNISGILFTNSTGSTSTFSVSDLPAGDHIISVRASDGEHERSAWVEIYVVDVGDPSNDRTGSGNGMIGWITVLVIIASVMAILLILFKMGFGPSKDEGEDDKPKS